jgi:hypothetical protein
VIREEEQAGPPPAAPRPGQGTRGDGSARPERPAEGNRAITATATAANPVARSAPDSPYGPDDPGYGPPGPDWYRRSQEEPEVAEAATTYNAADEPAAVRSPFEPLAHTSSASWPGEAGGTSAEQPAAGYEDPDLDDLDPGESEDGALGMLKNLYVSAERMGAETTGTEGAERKLDQLLERQRKLISEYFKESGGLEASGLAVSDMPSAR